MWYNSEFALSLEQDKIGIAELSRAEQNRTE